MLDLETGKKSKWTDKEAVSDLRTFRLSDRYLVLVWLEGYESPFSSLGILLFNILGCW